MFWNKMELPFFEKYKFQAKEIFGKGYEYE